MKHIYVIIYVIYVIEKQLFITVLMTTYIYIVNNLGINNISAIHLFKPILCNCLTITSMFKRL